MSDEHESEQESEHATTDESGKVKVDIEDAGGRELRDVDEKPPDDEVKAMEEERERRLDPDNRPDDAEVDNTHRTFDSDTGHFTDSDDFDESVAPYAGSGEED
jgi:hypothetical protein